MPHAPGWLAALGGLGLFLFGMGAMTEGLRALAGPALARWLARSTRSVVGGTLTGAAATALVQSSSAVTVTAIGFVNAGLLPFERTLGLVYGANIGTTATGWMIALLGFQVDLGAVAPVLVLGGALLRLVERGRAPAAGTALAGFGLLFTGLAVLQEGMAGLAAHLTPADLPQQSGVVGRLLLVGLGFVLTVVMQSSSAALAAGLSALAAGSIDLAQAMALVIGMNAGTTSTALLASLGGTAAARRTALAHVAFNLVTGVVAFGSLPFWDRWFASSAQVAGNPALALALFHTAFNVGGALLFLPLSKRFAAVVARAVVEHESGAARRLDPRLLAQPHIALETLAATVRELGRQALRHVALDLRSPQRAADRKERVRALLDDVRAAREYLGDITIDARDEGRRAAAVELLDALDHVQRMLARTAPRLVRPEAPSVPHARFEARLRRRATALAGPLVNAAGALRDRGAGADVEALRAAWEAVDGDAQALREEALQLAASDRLEIDEALVLMDEVRRVTRVARHAYRLAQHLAAAGRSVSAATPLAVPLEGAG
jgi:phosphate:Na+ symporter